MSRNRPILVRKAQKARTLPARMVIKDPETGGYRPARNATEICQAQVTAKLIEDARRRWRELCGGQS